jgi:hypothetical protein
MRSPMPFWSGINFQTEAETTWRNVWKMRTWWDFWSWRSRTCNWYRLLWCSFLDATAKMFKVSWVFSCINMGNGYDPVSAKRSQSLSQSIYSNHKSCYSPFSYKMRYAGHPRDGLLPSRRLRDASRAYLGREHEPVGAAGLEALVDFTKPWRFQSDFARVQAMALLQPSGTPAEVQKCPDHRFPEEKPAAGCREP